mmetsp:Transcript_95242/g.238729  ORF Transcript_95242/g.238729 Transcript_95242/m.238729 type:complete len:219 (+) Transcript_95242:1085-1741(+)
MVISTFMFTETESWLGSMTDTSWNFPTCSAARMPTTIPTTITLPTEAKHKKRNAERLALKHIGASKRAASVVMPRRIVSSLWPCCNHGAASSAVGASKSASKTKYAICVNQQIKKTRDTVSFLQNSPNAACPTSSNVSRPVHLAHSISISKVQALKMADKMSVKVPRTRPHWLIAYGSESTPPPTIVATKEKVAEGVRIFRPTSSKARPRYSKRLGPN